MPSAGGLTATTETRSTASGADLAYVCGCLQADRERIQGESVPSMLQLPVGFARLVIMLWRCAHRGERTPAARLTFSRMFSILSLNSVKSFLVAET